jgi:hypothetical protein
MMLIFAFAAGLLALADESPSMLVAIGAEGESEYAAVFGSCANRLEEACGKGAVQIQVIGRADPAAATDRDALREAIAREANVTGSPLWLLLIGHGTFDGREAKFNLRGPDVSAKELKEWLAPMERPVVVVGAFSSSGPFVAELTGPNRIVLTATRSGFEQNFSRFAEQFTHALVDPASDYDRDGQTSVLEAFLAASRRVEDYYKREGRLATEHALIDDNGDGAGTPADFFQGTRVVKQTQDGKLPDGARAHLIHLIPSESERAMPPEKRKRRDELELRLAELRAKKQGMNEADYYLELEEVLVPLAEVYGVGDPPAIPSEEPPSQSN